MSVIEFIIFVMYVRVVCTTPSTKKMVYHVFKRLAE